MRVLFVWAAVANSYFLGSTSTLIIRVRLDKTWPAVASVNVESRTALVDHDAAELEVGMAYLQLVVVVMLDDKL